MGLVDKLKQQGSTLSGLDGKTPPKGENTTPLVPKSLIDSQLDLDGKTPKKYLDNPPR